MNESPLNYVFFLPLGMPDRISFQNSRISAASDISPNLNPRPLIRIFFAVDLIIKLIDGVNKTNNDEIRYELIYLPTQP